MIYMDEDEMNRLPLPFCESQGLEGSRDSEVVLQILQDVYFMYICTVCFTHNEALCIPFECRTYIFAFNKWPLQLALTFCSTPAFATTSDTPMVVGPPF